MKTPPDKRWANLEPEPRVESYEIIHKKIEDVSEWVWRKGDRRGFDMPGSQWYSIRDLVLKHTPNRELIVQAGGCCGMYPRLWSKYFKTVHTFEPVPPNFEALCRNCPSDNIHKHACALGDTNRRVHMTGGREIIQKDEWGNTLRKNVGMYWVRGYQEDGVYQLMLDQLNLPIVNAIQLDVEKYEIHALKGAEKTIRKFSPTICVETFDGEVSEFLGALGYVVVGHTEHEIIPEGDTVLVRNP